MIVCDASIVLSWYFEDEAAEERDAVLPMLLNERGTAPLFWPVEVASTLQRALRRNRISRSYRDGALDDIAALPIALAVDTNEHIWFSTIDVADRHGLTVYDAAYLDLAIRLGLRLASIDRQLAAAAQSEGVPVLP